MELLLSGFPGLTLTYHNRYKHLHSGLSAPHTTGTLRELISIHLSSHQPENTWGPHRMCQTLPEKRLLFPKAQHSATGTEQLFDASDFWIWSPNFIPEKDEEKKAGITALNFSSTWRQQLLPLCMAVFLEWDFGDMVEIIKTSLRKLWLFYNRALNKSHAKSRQSCQRHVVTINTRCITAWTAPSKAFGFPGISLSCW